MVVGQVALTLVLVVTAGLLLESFRAIANVDAGIDAAGVATVSAIPNASHVDAGTWWRTLKDAQQRIEALPGVVVGRRVLGAAPDPAARLRRAQGFDDPAVAERISETDFTACRLHSPHDAGVVPRHGHTGVRRTGSRHRGPRRPVARLGGRQPRLRRALSGPGESPIGKRISAYAGPWYTIVRRGWRRLRPPRCRTTRRSRPTTRSIRRRTGDGRATP